MDQYNPKNIDKALKRMEKSDTLKDINRSETNIMSFFNDIEEDNKLEKQKSAAELKKEQYLEKINSLKKLVKNIGTKEEINRITAIGALIETTNFLSLKPDRKKILKENMIWCNTIYKHYIKNLDS
jgi:ferritin-like metal-binding protein YciE